MKYLGAGLAVASLFAFVQAVNVNGDPTDLNNYPACGQKCIPNSLGPPSDCGSLSNTTCICATAGFAEAIATCELATCSSAEQQQINTLAAALCASVGGIAPIESAVQESILASSQLQISATPTYSPSVTAVDQASSVLATATPAPNLGNPAAAEAYPECALTCANETAALITEPNNLYQICGVEYRTLTAVCEAAICSNLDRQNTQLVAQQLCRPFYANNAALGSSVIASIASATPIAAVAVAGKNVTDSSNWPQCAQNCQRSSNVGGCGSLTNQTCFCGNATAISQLSDCEDATCSADDRLRTRALGYQICASFGGISTLPSNSTNTSTISPSPSPFTGQAHLLSFQGGSWVVSALALIMVVVWL